MVAQWVMTLKFFIIKPKWNWHSEIDLSGGSGYDISGRFTLMDREMLGHGTVGSLELRMSWKYLPHFDSMSGVYDHTSVPTRKLKALDQLKENSEETRLRLGNILLVSQMLDSFPLLVDVDRVTIRDVHFFLGDLFRGFLGAEETGVKDHAIDIRVIEVMEALHAGGKDEGGITIWDFCKRFWVKGVLPVVASKAGVLIRIVEEVFGGSVSGMMVS